MTQAGDLAESGRGGVIGAGAAGGALAQALAQCGASLVAVAGRERGHARALAEVLPGAVAALPADGVVAASDLVFLAVADDVIASLATTLPWREGQQVVHLSGASGMEILAPAAVRG